MSVAIVSPFHGDYVPPSFGITAHYCDFTADSTITISPGTAGAQAAPMPSGSVSDTGSGMPGAPVNVTATAVVGGMDSITVHIAPPVIEPDPIDPVGGSDLTTAGGGFVELLVSALTGVAVTVPAAAAAGQMKFLRQTGYIDPTLPKAPAYVTSVAHRVRPGRPKTVVAAGVSLVRPNGQWGSKLEPSVRLGQPNVFYVVQSTAYTDRGEVISVSSKVIS